MAGQADIQLGKCKSIQLRRDNICYIVAAIAFRNGTDGREVLLMQEAKKSCRGQWYLPAGKVEPGETIEEAMEREMREETGIQCEPETLISVETQGTAWYRMAYAVKITGGTLKTEPDEESIGAGWKPMSLLRREPCPLKLRCRDILEILTQAERYADWQEGIQQQMPRGINWSRILCRAEPQPGLFAQLVIIRTGRHIECIVRSGIHNQHQLMDVQSLPNAFPTVEFGFDHAFPSILDKVYRHLLVDGHSALELPESVTAIWCLPAPATSRHHGIRLQLLCRHKQVIERAQVKNPEEYHWIELNRPEVLASLYLMEQKFRPQFSLL